MEKEDKFQGDINGIAVIGMEGRFPGADNIQEFWENLCEGKETIKFFSDEELLSAGISIDLVSNSNYVKAHGSINRIEYFDGNFFGLTPREVEYMDPQHRLFLECAWEALEQGGYVGDNSTNSIGVFAGCASSTYFLQNILMNTRTSSDIGAWQIAMGNEKDHLPTRTSFKLGLNGPSISINTACSTSLVAIHTACQSLLNYQCDIAVAGAANLKIPQNTGYLYQEGWIASSDGHTRAFDDKASGSSFGDGVGVVLLKRLEDAIADRDHILAIVKGSAINNDGSDKIGYTAPSIEGQAEVIATAQALAGASPHSITYIEAHGTGTQLGDPIEIAALKQVFEDSQVKSPYCAIGSVKTNIGHLETAAGMAGFIKTVLAVKNKVIPPTLHFEKPNPEI
ncbi:beta-ketoacyl synthase N-terminal-like domain-containing protein, partial [Bacillus wiedmannii]|uniref:beta-ketoacyl synthase N-terminal-like domain-containing protein n=1 Tax=Bacillus wiedmannii TaxID=1890302 RepID=UPI001C54FB33